MTTRTSALLPLETALYAKLAADALLKADLAPALDIVPATSAIFSLGTVPKDQPTPFLELGDVGESAWRTFGKGGNRDEQTIVIVSPRAEGIPGVAKILAHLVRLLEDVVLVVAGHQIALSRIELITTYNDPNGTDIRGPVRFTVQSLNA